MCGVVSIAYGRETASLGREAASLVRKLEYRGYDSTGVATIRDDDRITLRKKVGAPSRVVEELDVERMAGRKAIGQVRWATYGSVTDANAQPHEVACRVRMVGAHNGNLSNTDRLKEFLAGHRHAVLSDNDGEMLVHVVEQHFSETAGHDSADPAERTRAAIAAIRAANGTVIGSYAACFAFPGLEGIFAVKAGSSLYAGKGSDEAGDFFVVSSDLTSVLSKTRFLVPLAEGEGIHFTHASWTVFSLAGSGESSPPLRRSKLNVADVSLQSRYHFFMEQEIAQTPENLEPLSRYYFPHDWERPLFEVFERREAAVKGLVFELLRLGSLFDRDELAASVRRLFEGEPFRALHAELLGLPGGAVAARGAASAGFESDEAPLLHELLALGEEFRERLLVLDLAVIWKKKRQVLRYKREAIARIRAAKRVFLLGSGTSSNAALVGAGFFADLARLVVIPANPGSFRSACLPGLAAGDLVIGISQSGETKDLVDVFNDIRARHGADEVGIVSIVNNENSTLPQEKSDFYLPVLCGPEIAVAATKSFVNQLAVLYLLAAGLAADEATVARKLDEIRATVAATIRIADEEVQEVALRLFLAPSMHILGTSLVGLAREGALKVREVVLNHTEGYDSSEFKHGPNTILGKNTVFGLRELESLLADVADWARVAAATPGVDAGRLLELVRDFRFLDFTDELVARGAPAAEVALTARLKDEAGLEARFSNYPLLFLCPPDERDRRITVTQIHTHKIRGADVVLVAEEDDDLRRAVDGRPAGFPAYWSKIVRVPRSGDRNVFAFQAAVVLQLLALRMSVAKMKYLNKIRVENHGVHPDVPKNVSKSITVD